MINKENYTKVALKKINDSLGIIIDTREKQPHTIVYWLEENNIPYKFEKLDYGDYSFYIPENEEFGIEGDIDFDKEIAIERKNSVDELIGNFVKRNRIEAEFKNKECEMYLLIEGTYEDMASGNYQSAYPAKSALATYHSFIDRYDLKPAFIPNDNYTPIFMYNTFKYYLRNRLKK